MLLVMSFLLDCLAQLAKLCINGVVIFKHSVVDKPFPISPNADPCLAWFVLPACQGLTILFPTSY